MTSIVYIYESYVVYTMCTVSDTIQLYVKFILYLNITVSLAYVPENKVIESYEKLLDTKYFIENDELLSPILNYFDDTWIGSTDRGQKRRSLTFKISLVSENLPRTNNAVEVWHNCFT